MPKNAPIADALIVPALTRGNTNIPAIMVSEKLADAIGAQACIPALRAREGAAIP